MNPPATTDIVQLVSNTGLPEETIRKLISINRFPESYEAKSPYSGEVWDMDEYAAWRTEITDLFKADSPRYMPAIYSTVAFQIAPRDFPDSSHSPRAEITMADLTEEFRIPEKSILALIEIRKFPKPTRSPGGEMRWSPYAIADWKFVCFRRTSVYSDHARLLIREVVDGWLAG